MIDPKKINTIAKKYEDENYGFRAYLKEHADGGELDSQFQKLHNELFADYDCCKCANCCRAYAVTLNKSDVDRISNYLGQDRNDFITEHLEKSEFDEDCYNIKEEPCIFLCVDGKCNIQDIKPQECKGFPFTDQPDRLGSLLGVIDFAEECPVVFEILERLKKIYWFKYRTK